MKVEINFMSGFGFMLHQAIKELPTSLRKWQYPNMWEMNEEDYKAVKVNILEPYYFLEADGNLELNKFLSQFRNETNKEMW